MNVCFLDVDGVLNSMAYFETIKGHRDRIDDEIDESKLPILKRIVEENNALIVLSSTWRDLDDESCPTCYKMWQYLNQSLAKYGMYIYDKTPILAQDRPVEIKAWLDSQSNKDEIKWISIEDDWHEDDYEECGLGGHLIQTIYFTCDPKIGGLQDYHVALAREMFERQGEKNV